MELDNKKAIVIGSGIMGLSTAWSLVKQGIEHVTLIDSHKFPRKTGAASYDGSRSIRYVYGFETGYMIMVKDAYEVWDELFNDLGEKLYTPTGTLNFQNKNVNINPDRSDYMPSSMLDSYEAINQYKDFLDIDVEYLTPNEIKNRFPYFNCDDIEYAIWTSTGGILHADDILTKTFKWLQKCSNLTILDGPEYEVIKVTPFHQNKEISNKINQHVCFLKSGQIIEGDFIVIAINNFTNDLLPEVKAQGKLRSARSEVTYFEVPEEDKHNWQTMPFMRELKDDFSFFFFPYVGGTNIFGIKAGDHRRDFDSDIHTDDFVPKKGFNQPCIDWVNHRLISKSGKPIAPNKVKVCYYDNYPENRFQLHSLDPTNTCIALYGFSAHGFKFGPLIGKAISSIFSHKLSYESTKKWLSGATTLRFSQLN